MVSDMVNTVALSPSHYQSKLSSTAQASLLSAANWQGAELALTSMGLIICIYTIKASTIMLVNSRDNSPALMLSGAALLLVTGGKGQVVAEEGGHISFFKKI